MIVYALVYPLHKHCSDRMVPFLIHSTAPSIERLVFDLKFIFSFFASDPGGMIFAFNAKGSGYKSQFYFFFFSKFIYLLRFCRPITHIYDQFLTANYHKLISIDIL